jgi:hypothetical protein
MSAADSAIAYALAQVGKPYVYGATGPNGYDCSGLVMAAYAHAGIKLPRTTYAQVLVGTRISSSRLLAPGDLVFPDPGHVQIYLGNGRVVEAPHTGAQVRVMNMWGFWTARRVTAPGSTVINVDNPNGVPNPNVGQGDLKDPKTGKNCFDVTMTGVGPVFIWNGNCPDSMKNDAPASPSLPPGIPNPLDALTGVLGDIGSKLAWITQPENWLRIGEFVAGMALLIIGLIGMSRVMNAVKKTGKVAQNAAS